MPALTQCWYTRVHSPNGRKHREADGSFVSECRYCHKPIASWAKNRWYLADGFNVSQLRESVGGRYLYVIDVADEFVVARYPLAATETEATIRAMKDELRKSHGLSEAGCTLELRDSRDDAGAH